MLTLTLLIAIAALASVASLADSFIRGRNAWRTIKERQSNGY